VLAESLREIAGKEAPSNVNSNRIRPSFTAIAFKVSLEFLNVKEAHHVITGVVGDVSRKHAYLTRTSWPSLSDGNSCYEIRTILFQPLTSGLVRRIVTLNFGGRKSAV